MKVMVTLYPAKGRQEAAYEFDFEPSIAEPLKNLMMELTTTAFTTEEGKSLEVETLLHEVNRKAGYVCYVIAYINGSYDAACLRWKKFDSLRPKVEQSTERPLPAQIMRLKNRGMTDKEAWLTAG